MIDSSIFWLRVAACLYALGLVNSMLVILRHKQSVFRAAFASFRVAVVLHAVAIVDLSIALGRVPVANYYETLSLCAFLIALVFLMTLVAAMERPVAGWADQRVRDVWLVVHILLVLAGYAALLLTSVAALFYLVQERRLKLKKVGTWLEKLPPLATLDNLVGGSLGLGFVFITLGVVFGMLWAFIESGTRWIGDAKITLSLFTWVLLLVMMFLRAAAGWRGRKTALMALMVLGCSALTWIAHAGLRPALLP